MKSERMKRARQIEPRHVDVMADLVKQCPQKRPRLHDLLLRRGEHPHADLGVTALEASVEPVKLASRGTWPGAEHFHSRRRRDPAPTLRREAPADLVDEPLRRAA